MRNEATATTGLETLALVEDDATRPAAENMAVDEALLAALAAAGSGPVLRVYRWARPAVSFGYFEPWASVAARFGPDRDRVRRWTGGGVVEHGFGLDWTYSLLVPRAAGAFADLPAEVSYRLVHAGLRGALENVAGWNVELASAGARVSGRSASELNACFARPVFADVLLADGGEKVAGAAQRRTRAGLLHQGSVRAGAAEPPLTGDLCRRLAERFARSLAGKTAGAPGLRRPLAPEVEAAAAELARTRYGTAAWTEKF